MAIKVVDSRYPGFIFDGENSRDYGVYITGVEVFGAPKRNVQMISIPGRDGNYALDKGSFENIPVKYECVLGAGTEEDFNNGISDFRNWLASKVGYKVLSDEINLGEYRKGVFPEGMEVPTLNKKTGTFDIVFDCMPQRWLDDASALPVEIASGDDIFNPTLFEASPLLSVWGYGEISVGGEIIEVQNVPIGDVTIAKNTSRAVALNGTTAVVRTTATIVEGLLENGDTFTVKAQGGSSVCNASMASSQQIVDSVTFRRVETSINIESVPNYHDSFANQTAIFKPVSFVYGTSKTAYCDLEVSVTAHEIETPSNSLDYSFTMGFQMSYDGQNTITLRQTIRNSSTSISGNMSVSYNAIEGISSKSSLGDPLYIDLEIGEAYKEENGETISSNTGVSLPPKLPTLKTGHNTITYDNTVERLVIEPRWWKV